MTNATTPTAQMTATPNFNTPGRMCDLQWRRWRGPVAVFASSHPHRPIMSITVLQRGHREWLLSLLARGIPIRAIRRLALDDPREPLLVLEARTQLYLERKSKRRNDQ